MDLRTLNSRENLFSLDIEEFVLLRSIVSHPLGIKIKGNLNTHPSLNPLMTF